MTHRQLSFQIDFSALAGRTKRLIWRVTQLSAFALSAVDKVRDEDFGPLTLPDSRVELGPRHVPDPQTRTAFRQWVIACALRDSVESIIMLLDEVRRVCAIARFSKRGQFPADEWTADERAQTEFHMATFSQKLRSLSREFGVKLPKGQTSALFTLMAARNCLVHRLGTVSEVDRNSAAGLTVKWFGLELQVVGAAGTRHVETMPAAIDAGETLQILSSKRTRSFGVGTAMDFSTAEFTAIGLFLQAVTDSITQLTI